MAKGAYSIIAYPESCNLNQLVSLVVGMGAEYEYILHDRDNQEDGTHKKDHVHFLCGWENHFPKWGEFKRAVQSVGAVAISVEKCVVKDITKIEEYLIHSNDPHKFQYSPWYIVKSEGWDSSLYETAHDKRERDREAKKADKNELTFQVIALIEENDIMEMADLTITVATQFRQYRDILIEKHSFFDSFLRSKRNYFEKRQALLLRIGELEKQVETLQELNKKLQRENLDIGGDNTLLRKKIIELASTYDIVPMDFEI